MREPWQSSEMPEGEAARREAYQRLADAARRIGMPRERLADVMRQVASNQADTRRFLAEQVYGVPDDLLDDLLRVHLEQLREEEDR